MADDFNMFTEKELGVISAREELLLSIDEAEWSWLRPHLERGGLILVDDSLDLADAALKVASDDAATVEKWINAGKIGKPNQAQQRIWDAEKGKRFAMLVVNPYVFIQEKLPTLH